MSDICAACAGGPSEGAFTIKQVKSKRLSLSDVKATFAAMSNFEGVAICGSCMATAIAESGTTQAAKPETKAEGHQTSEPTAPAAAADPKDESLVSGIADSIERMRAEGFNPNAITSVYNATSGSEYTP